MSNAEHKCPICGKPTSTWYGNARKDGLCREHTQMLKEGRLVQCPDCGKYHLKDEKCECKKEIYTELPREGFENCIICNAKTNGYAFCKDCYRKHPYDELLNILNKSVKIKEESIEKNIVSKKEETNETYSKEKDPSKNEIKRGKCLICGNPTSNDYMFCPECYYKYKNKSLLFKVTECTHIVLLDDSYEGKLRCKDGHIVKSKSERSIDDYLYDHGIFHAYEKNLNYGPDKDFYIPNYLGEGKDLYIEHWGYSDDNIEYTKTKKFKLQIYQKQCKEKGITLVNTYEDKDISEIDSALERKLNKSFIKIGEIND